MSETKPNPLAILDGNAVALEGNETVLELAARHGVEIPTLCHDPRLDPTGACRMCLVEIEGWPRLAPACATVATPGMTITSESPRIARHRSSLLALYLTDHHARDADSCEDGRPCELHALAERYDAPTDWHALEPVRDSRDGDPNPYIRFDASRCILCARCTRYCDEVEAVSAITLAGRGAKTTIATADHAPLVDTTCEMCGGCVDVCPTGAMAEKMPLAARAPRERELEKVRTTCNYCGVGCQMDLNVDRAAQRVVKVTSPPPGTTTNDGNLCVKGRFAYDFIHHADRLTTPMIRDAGDRLVRTSWDEALRRVAEGLGGVKERHGPDALGFVSSSRCTVEENYLMQKLARAVFDTNNVHQCAAT